MSLPIVLLPTGRGVGLYSLQLGLQYSLMQHGYKVATFNPLKDCGISPQEIEAYFRNDQIKEFFELLLEKHDEKTANADIVLITGTFIKNSNNRDFLWLNDFSKTFNITLTRAFNAYVILITHQGKKALSEIESQLTFAQAQIDKQSIIGAIITKLNAPVDNDGQTYFSLLDEQKPPLAKTLNKSDIANLPIFKLKHLTLLGITQWQDRLTYPRIGDIKRLLKAKTLCEGDQGHRVKTITMYSRSINYILEELNPGTLIVTSADRADIMMAACFAAQKGIPLAGLLLTASYHIHQEMLSFCLEVAQKAKLPILSTQNKSVSTILKLASIDYTGIPQDDIERLEMLQHSIAECIDIKPIEEKLSSAIIKKMSPAAFRYYLTKQASQRKQRIILPEAEEPRILKAASFCQNRNIADCLLLGNPENIHIIAKKQGIKLPQSLTIIDPNTIKSRYIAPLVALRKHKGMTEVMAQDALEDGITLATMMLAESEVDGLVAGSTHTTAHTITPAFKLIKTKPGCTLVSSVFFMCLEDQVMVYGDCAVNPDPTAQQLAEIAIQSAISATQFGIEPKIAMISYSTGSSGSGDDVEKVKEATLLVKQSHPEFIIDGPLQYDAATVPEVAKAKAPDSAVAGCANVIIFPDLNTGNTTYKAVQRSAKVLSIGPILQGLNKPVNDLSRGTTVDDIIYTIAITAIQAQRSK
ncbi:phosphate acetyltransferase [Facilibium subflavum]|uniref:phosphate acetyltransferase n=1 Tax=Facilibium subflavum TaxID=2219058 RepID=UPI000E64C1B9|nr:phosphate acetyltransferase [Facilibium subflavum]